MPSQFFERSDRSNVEMPIFVINDLEVEEAEWDRNCMHIYPSDNYVYALSALEDVPRELQRRKSFDTSNNKLR
jgi:hypothetical protein